MTIGDVFAAGRIEEARAFLERAEARKAGIHPGLKKAVLAR